MSEQVLHVNGDSRPLANGQTLTALIEELGLAPETVAVELNREIVRRNEYAEIELKAGDKLEIVRFVQGG